ncbi:MAG: alpha-amylase/4-alpha-glucanotransferase domain-containing protein, partial [Nitrososphaerales archaeon]
GEKFGAWPTTYDRVFRDGWLDGFFKAVAREQDKGNLATVKLSEYLKENHPRKRIYLPSAAYPEMMEWSLPFNHPKVESHGFWRLFLSKYPESARIYSKMLCTSKLVHSVDSIPALIELWKGQCNDAYWHGIFGGLYAAILRKTTFEHLIRAQVISEKQRHHGNWISCDKLPQYTIVNTRNLCVSISPSLGGSITGLDFKPRYVNVFDTLARRPERYHKQLKLQKATLGKKGVRSIHETPHATEKGLENFLSYDKYDKTSFVDFLVDAETDQGSFTHQDFKEVAPFAGEEYKCQFFKQSNSVMTHLERIVKSLSTSISLDKEYKILQDSEHVSVKYSIKASNNLSCKFVPEINLGCLADSKFAQKYGRADFTSSGRVEILYPEVGIRAIVRAPKSSKIAMIPVWTVSQSEKGFENNLQGISILPFYEIDLRRNEKFQTELQFETKMLR